MKYLVVIGGGVLQLQTFIECEKLGLKTILIDGNENCYCKHYCDEFVPISIHEPENIVANLPEGKDIVGVYTQGCDAEYTVAYVAEQLGLPSIGKEAALNCKDKVRTRDVLGRAGILQPQVYWYEQRPVFPIIVKPSDNCGSRGITIVRAEDELYTAYHKAKKYSRNGKILIEEFIDGLEYSVDTIVYKGVVYPAGISDRVFLDKKTNAIQDGSRTPSMLLAHTQQKMYAVMQECAKATGVTWGAFKGDLIVDKNGKIYVIEVTARLSGGFDSQYRKPYSYGINLIKATIDLACGKELDFKDIIPKWVKWSQTFTVFPKPGKIMDIQGRSELREIPGIEEFFITKHIGELVEYNDCSDRVIHIIACNDSYEELQKTINQARKVIKFITEV